jgi:translation elongation factor EF-1alpha
LKKVGLHPDKIHIIPINAQDNENIIEISEKIKWYNGVQLVTAMLELNTPTP